MAEEVEDPRRLVWLLSMSPSIFKNSLKNQKLYLRNWLWLLYYIKSDSLMRQCLDELIDNDIRTRNEYQLTDALQLMIDKGEKFTTFP